VGAYAGSGSKPYHPALLVALLFYGDLITPKVQPVSRAAQASVGYE
jgi:hypothetical protein